ncbi:MAG: UDP-glucuronic acid decarboxylase family protein [Candidatus Micrarchaeota archaeon]
MKYLVTGAVGFLGTNLCLELLAKGNEVIGLDNLSTGSNKNLKKLKLERGFSFLKHNITKPLPKISDIEYIYNLACPASPPRYQKDPIQTFRTSIWGVWNVLRFAWKVKIPVFHASTSEVYGDPIVHPQQESYFGNVNPIGIRACYDEGKRGAETLLMDYNRMTGNPIKIVRIFNTYGPHMDSKDGRVISNFINQALEGKPLTIYGTGKQTRSFCYVDDLIAGILKVEQSSIQFNGPVNLGNPKEFTLLELAERIEKIIGKPLHIVFLPLPTDDPKQRRPDITLAMKKLDWKPATTLNDGLLKTIEYFRLIRD